MTPDPRIKALPADEIRRRFVEFFAERGHAVVQSASLVPAGDQTLLFTNSGMVQFKDVLTGAETRSYKRAVDYQRCLRVAGKHNDFEEVGRTTAPPHVLRDARQLELRRLLQARGDPLGLGLPDPRPRASRPSGSRPRPTRTTRSPARSGATRSACRPSGWRVWGDVDAGDDNNFWRMADTGPCGPCSEIHFDRGAHLSEGPQCVPDHSENCPRWLEIWNLVFMEFDQRPDGRVPAAVHERRHGDGPRAPGQRPPAGPHATTTRTCSRRSTRRMRELLGHDPEHVRGGALQLPGHRRPRRGRSRSSSPTASCRRTRAAATSCAGSSAAPSATGACSAGASRSWPTWPTVVVEVDGRRLSASCVERRDEILGAIEREEAPVRADARRGHRPARGGAHPADLGRARRRAPRRRTCRPMRRCCPASVAFRLHDTYGFPIDLTVELAAEYGVRVDRAGFEAALAEQRERSRERAQGRAGPARRADRPVPGDPGQGRRHEFLGYETTPGRRPRVVAIVRDGIEYAELEAVGDVDAAAGPGARPRSSSTGRRSTPRAAARSATAACSRGGRRSSCSRSRTRSGRWAGSSSTAARCTAGSGSARRVERRGRRRAARADDAQPHRHAPAPPRAAQRRRRARPPGRLAGDARLPALRLPARPGADDDEKRGDRGRGPPGDPRGPDGDARAS